MIFPHAGHLSCIAPLPRPQHLVPALLVAPEVLIYDIPALVAHEGFVAAAGVTAAISHHPIMVTVLFFGHLGLLWLPEVDHLDTLEPGIFGAALRALRVWVQECEDDERMPHVDHGLVPLRPGELAISVPR